MLTMKHREGSRRKQATSDSAALEKRWGGADPALKDERRQKGTVHGLRSSLQEGLLGFRVGLMSQDVHSPPH